MDRRERIIEVARGLIARYGFKKTTMSDIAQAAGVAKATLYHYFRSKEDILREIINIEGNLMRSRLLEVVEKDMRASDKLRSYSETRMHYLRQLVVWLLAVYFVVANITSVLSNSYELQDCSNLFA